MAKWYYKMAGQEIGPFTAQQLKQLAEEKRIAPTDPVRRDTDTEWSIARNVKGLFPEKSSIPTGVAMPVQPVSEDGEEPVPVVVPMGKLPKGSIPTAVAVPGGGGKTASPKGTGIPVGRAAVDIPAPPMAPPPPKAAQAVKRTKARPAAETEQEKTETFDFGFDSAVHSAPAGGKRTAPARKAAVKAGGKAQTNAAQNGGEDDSAEEKRPLTKKEIQKRNFLICLIATGAVIVLAVLILLIVSCGRSEKPKTDSLNDPAVSAVENTDGETADQESEDGADAKDAENADGEADAEDTDDEGAKKSEDGEDADGKDSEDGAKNALPEEWAEIGYKSPLVDGKPMSCTFGSLKVFIKKIEIASLADLNPNSKAKSKDRKYCFIKIEVENVNADGKLLDVPGWGAKGTPLVQLFDEKENQYKTQRIQVPDQADSSMQIGQGESFTDILAFNPPKLEKVEFLRLILPPVQKGESECLLYLPKEFFAPEKNADDAAAEAADGMEENADGETDGGEAAEDGEGVEDAENTADPENRDDADASEESGDADVPAREPSALDDPSLGGMTGEPAGLVEELDKTPPPVDAESKELEEASFDALNDPDLN
ncbi:MAG: DUF4339 domain-containing protein [Thermoguttaceae bacterium]|nr:DUF4339 domain-containing protein [Thermoguttaceae bacterium]